MPAIVRDESGVVSKGTMKGIEAVAEAALRSHGNTTEGEATIVLTDDEVLRRFNKTYRNIDRPTDVLSFPMEAEDTPPGEMPYLGDVVISVEQAQASATARGQDVAGELELLAVHGVLHLLGYEDETDEGALLMRRAEAALGVRSADEVD